MADAAPRGKMPPPRSVPPRESRPENTLPPLQIRYYRRMSRQRVYNVTVGWPKSRPKPPAGTPPVSVRLLMAGAQVVPSEHVLDPNKADAQATFYVTPLARGWLRSEKLEVIVQGRKVQETRLASKVCSQRMTAVLLLLTLIVPWFILNYLKYAPPGSPQGV